MYIAIPAVFTLGAARETGSQRTEAASGDRIAYEYKYEYKYEQEQEQAQEPATKRWGGPRLTPELIPALTRR